MSVSGINAGGIGSNPSEFSTERLSGGKGQHAHHINTSPDKDTVISSLSGEEATAALAQMSGIQPPNIDIRV